MNRNVAAVIRIRKGVSHSPPRGSFHQDEPCFTLLGAQAFHLHREGLQRAEAQRLALLHLDNARIA